MNTKKYLLHSLVCLYLLCFSVSITLANDQGQGARFFSAMPDVPLMQGMDELESETLVFDKPEGRIIEAYAAMGGLSTQTVLAYYESALPAFGWQKKAQNSYQRDKELLSLRFEGESGAHSLHLSIRPAGSD